MTQEYEPIEITTDMPEPGASGAYLVGGGADDIEAVWRKEPQTYGQSVWFDQGQHKQTWDELRVTWPGYHIQSLADHDAQIRAEALELSVSEIDIVRDELPEIPGVGGVSDEFIIDAFKALGRHRAKTER